MHGDSPEKIVVITGASGGIGAALARHLADRGRRLVLVARREPELKAVAADAEARGAPVARPVVTDVTRRGDVERLRDAALAAFGHIDVWVNNAGRGITRPVLELTEEELDEMLAVNLKSALYGMQAIVPHFLERGAGHLVNVSSFLGRIPIAPIRSAYAAAKAALNSLTANLRMELAERSPNVRVSLVLPGLVSTEFARRALGAAPGAGTAPPPAGPMQPQTAEEVAEVIGRVIEAPIPDVYTNPALAEIALRYYQDVAAFEREAFLRLRAAEAKTSG
jgi:short-subunit dehydrogenase